MATSRALHAVPPTRRREPLLRDAVGDLLRRERHRRGMTLRQLAAASQVSLAFLSEVERGRKEPSSEVLAAICRALGLQLVDLVGALHAELGGARPALTSRSGPAASTTTSGPVLLAA
jgi:transcriptional regulator with XRE-family HTH domain